MDGNISLQKKGNCFDLFRYWAAFSVMFLHFTGFANIHISSESGLIDGIRSVATFAPGVVVLFAMSGYLIVASRERSADTKEFFIKRIARMYPELWVCTLVNIVMILSLAREMLDGSFILWIFTQVFGIANTPKCLLAFGTGSVNGALWTIFTEIQLYIVLAFSYRLLKKLSMQTWMVFLFLLAVINIGSYYLAINSVGLIAKMIERLFLPYALWFFIGVFCYLKRETVIPWLKKLLPLLLIVYILVRYSEITIPGYYTNIGIGILCPFLVIGGALSFPMKRIKVDLTYGMFLYHWIVLNIIVHFKLFGRIKLPVLIFCYVAVTLFFSYLSWRYVGSFAKKVTEKLLK